MRYNIAVLVGLLSLPLSADFLVNATAATVGKSLITVEECYLYRSVRRFLDKKPKVFSEETGDALLNTVKKIIFERMVAAEIENFKYKGVERAEAENVAREAIKGRKQLFEKILRRYGKSKKEVVELIWRNLQVESFVKSKVETLTPIITDAEVERYFRQTKQNNPAARLENLKPHIVLILKKQHVEKGLQEWVRSLNAKYAVTNHLAK